MIVIAILYYIYQPEIHVSMVIYSSTTMNIFCSLSPHDFFRRRPSGHLAQRAPSEIIGLYYYIVLVHYIVLCQ